jgi:hypothetical protein
VSDGTDGTIVVLAKEPLPGRAKTRLCPPFSSEAAAALAAAALADTFAAVSAARCGRRVAVFDGEPGPWVPSGFDRVVQVSGGLDARLAGAFAATSGPTVLIGMDTPQVDPSQLEDSLQLLGDHDAVLGPAEDGGYWLVGLRRSNPSVFLGVPMSSGATFVRQHARLRQLGLRTATVMTLRDVDDHEDAAAVAAAVPSSRFAATYDSVSAVPRGMSR